MFELRYKRFEEDDRTDSEVSIMFCKTEKDMLYTLVQFLNNDLIDTENEVLEVVEADI